MSNRRGSGIRLLQNEMYRGGAPRRDQWSETGRHDETGRKWGLFGFWYSPTVRVLRVFGYSTSKGW